jgi:hypothetical protein
MSELSRTGGRCCFRTGADPGTNPNYDEKKKMEAAPEED